MSKLSCIVLILLGSFTILISQEYDVKIWGVKVGYARFSVEPFGNNKLIIEAPKYLDELYQIDFSYRAKFNTTTFNVLHTEKYCKQGSNDFEYSAEYHEGLYAVYNKKDTVNISMNTLSLLSLISKILVSPIDSIDAKWVNLENEGVLYKARPLWNDTTTVNIGNRRILCDNYRLDLKIVDDSNKLYEKTDYFNDNFFDINSIRQIWVETWQKQRRLVKIALKSTLMSLEIEIKD